MAKKIAIGADHGGFGLKQKIKTELEKIGYNVIDVGPGSEDPCDYPVYGFEAAKKVAKKEAKTAIVICKSGIGMSIVANKLPGVRAALCRNAEDAASSREHNDSNILVLGAARTGSRKAMDIVKTWINTDFAGGRHARRVRKIVAFEKKIFKKIR